MPSGENLGGGKLAANHEQKLSAYTQKFRIMLQIMSPPDGGHWGPTKMKNATGGRIGTSYFIALRDGQVDIPRADKIATIAEAMRFPPHLWFKDLDWWQHTYDAWANGEDVSDALSDEKQESVQARISRLLNQLFDLKPSTETGESLSEAEVAHMSHDALSVQRISELRNGQFDSVSQEELAALCGVFEVSPTYWSQEPLAWRGSSHDLGEMIDADSYETMQNSMKLSHDNRGMLRRLSEYLNWQQGNK